MAGHGRKLSVLALAGSLAACSGAATGEPRSAANEPTSGEAGQQAPLSGDPVELAAAGLELLEAGRCGEAIDRAFDPALLGFAAQYDDPAVRLLFARDAGMGLVQLLGAAGDQRNAVLLDPVWPDTLYYKAYCLVELGDLAAAEAALNRALELMPDDAVYLCELGHIYHAREQWTAAIAIFERALQGARGMAAAAEAAAQSGAVAPYRVLGKTPVEWQTRALRGIGFSYIELGELDAAQQTYEQVLQLDPNDQQARNELQYIAELRAQGVP